MSELSLWYWRRAQEDSGANDFDPETDCHNCCGLQAAAHAPFCSEKCKAEAEALGHDGKTDDEIYF